MIVGHKATYRKSRKRGLIMLEGFVVSLLLACVACEADRSYAQTTESVRKIVFAFAANPARANCDPIEPMIAGSTSQGGYSFQYQSWKGKNCRVYRICNNPGRELTPVLWKDKHEVFIDTSLLRCPAGLTCQCAEVIKPTRQTFQSRSTLSYGINKDEYREAPPAYSDPEYQVWAPEITFPYFVVVRGMVADTDGQPVTLGVGLVSDVSVRRDRLIYQMTVTSESRDLQILKLRPAKYGDLSLKWPGADSQAFQSYLTSKGAFVVPANNQRILVDIVPRSGYVLGVDLMTLSSAGKSVFATTAPAYTPSEEWNPKK